MLFDGVLAFLFGGAPGWPEMMIVGIIALLLFGKRLPEVARSLGKGIVEFKKGVKGIEDEVEHSSYNNAPTTSSARPVPHEEVTESTAPKFELPDSAPTSAAETSSENS